MLSNLPRQDQHFDRLAGLTELNGVRSVFDEDTAMPVLAEPDFAGNPTR
jgi:hypothetical protein